MTIHRSQNLTNLNNLKNIMKCFNELSKNIKIIFPVHPNTKNIINKNKIDISNILSINSTSYLEMMELLKNCKFVATDSGGLQKEALFAKKQVFTIRAETEWPETLINKNNILCPPNNLKKMQNKIIKYFDKKFTYSKNNFFGNGKSSKKIISSIINFKY